MKHLLLVPFFVVTFLLIQSCKDKAFVFEPQEYAYLQHSSFTIDTSNWAASGHDYSYTVTMQNLGTGVARNIRTQLLFKEPFTNELSTRYFQWRNSDSSLVEIPPGGSVTYTVNDTLTYRDSVVYWNLSYNSNPVNNAP